MDYNYINYLFVCFLGNVCYFMHWRLLKARTVHWFFRVRIMCFPFQGKQECVHRFLKVSYEWHNGEACSIVLPLFSLWRRNRWKTEEKIFQPQDYCEKSPRISFEGAEGNYKRDPIFVNPKHISTMCSSLWQIYSHWKKKPGFWIKEQRTIHPVRWTGPGTTAGAVIAQRRQNESQDRSCAGPAWT